MARLRGKDLAALGLLGTAAMMTMGRGKKGETKTATPTPSSGMAQSEKILSELGEDSGFRRNLETGDLYEDVLNKPAARPTITPRATAPVRDTRTPAQEAADDAKIFGANAPMEGRTASGIAREARGRINPTFTDRVRGGMKKGGKVKMKSASSRADGIAQRGKTRGKIV